MDQGTTEARDQSSVTQHTPAPWRLCKTGNIGSAIEAQSGRKTHDRDDGMRIICTYQECTATELYHELEANRRANGEFIVKAVNNHHALVKALSLALCELGACARQLKARDDGSIAFARKAARDALAAVGVTDQSRSNVSGEVNQ